MLRRACAAVVAVALCVPVAASADAAYTEPVWFSPATATIDVIVVPPSHGRLANEDGVGPASELTPENSYRAAILDAVEVWSAAVAADGAAWLRDGLRITVFVAGRDTIPASVLAEPEVLVASDETKGTYLGLAVKGPPCLVTVSKLYGQSFSAADVFNITAQEYGHCLGAGHVDQNRPMHDVMNGLYPHRVGAAGTARGCVSNLNVRTIELAFASALGRGAGGGTAAVAPSSYRAVAC